MPRDEDTLYCPFSATPRVETYACKNKQQLGFIEYSRKQNSSVYHPACSPACWHHTHQLLVDSHVQDLWNSVQAGRTARCVGAARAMGLASRAWWCRVRHRARMGYHSMESKADTHAGFIDVHGSQLEWK